MPTSFPTASPRASSPPVPGMSSDAARPAVVVVTHDTCEEVLGLLASLPTDEHAEVVVVDTGSSDGTAARVRARHAGVRVLELANAGFGRGANAGIRATSAPVVVVLNADVRVRPGALRAVAGALRADPALAAVGPQVRYPDGTLQASARCVPDLRTAIGHGLFGRFRPDNAATRHYHSRDLPSDRPRDVDWLSGCALALRRTAVEQVGGFDPGYFLYVEDLDLGQRLRAAGWRLRYEPSAEVTHRVGASTARRRGQALLAHARSLHRYQDRRLTGLRRGLLAPLRVALSGWVLATWVAERLSGAGASRTGERLQGTPEALLAAVDDARSNHG